MTTNRSPFELTCRRFWKVSCVLLVCVLAGTTGCASKKKQQQIEAAKRQAFAAGQEQAWQQYRLANPNSLRVIGPVANPILPWQEGVTLIRAIVAAQYTLPGDPKFIAVQRGLEQQQFNAQQLLRGNDFPLMPGDVIILRP